MAQIVYITYGISSYVNISLQLSKELVAAGHRVTYVSSLDIGDAVTRNGFDFVLLEDEAALRAAPEQQATERMGFRERIANRQRVAAARKNYRDVLVSSHELDRVFDELAPDFVLVDNELHQHVMATAARDVPLLLMQPWFSTLRQTNMPPLNSFLQPRGLLHRFRIDLRWHFFLLAQKLKMLFANRVFEGTHYVATMQAVAQEYGFDFDRRVSLTDFLPITYRDIPILFLNAYELDFLHQPRAIDHYVGPLIDVDRVQTGVDPQFAAVWQNLLTERDKTQNPLIYCSIGTFWPGDTHYLGRIIAAIARRPEWTMVLSIGRMLDASELGKLPANVHVFASVPQLEVLQHVDVLITHGGIATINEAILYGVPMLVYSTGHVDQNGCAARVAYHGLGLVAHKRRETPETMVYKLEALIHDKTYRRNVAAMQTVFQRYREEKPAVTIIEDMLANPNSA